MAPSPRAREREELEDRLREQVEEARAEWLAAMAAMNALLVDSRNGTGAEEVQSAGDLRSAAYRRYAGLLTKFNALVLHGHAPVSSE